MAFKIDFSEQAAADLSDIILYISDDLCNPQAAERFYKAVNEKLKMLQEQPYMFPVSQDEKLRADGYRFTVVGSFMIFYLVDNEKEMVSIAETV